MTSENEWVRIPESVTTLKKGTVCKFASGTTPFVMVEDVEVHPHERETIQITKADERTLNPNSLGNWAQREADLGDTPEHLKPLLRAARELVPGTLISEEESVGCLWSPELRRGYLYPYKPELLAGLASSFFNDPRDCGGAPRCDLRVAIEQGRCYPTADARRIGREEFGMAFEGDPLPEANDTLGLALNRLAGELGCGRNVEVVNGLKMYETDDALRVRLQPFVQRRLEIGTLVEIARMNVVLREVRAQLPSDMAFMWPARKPDRVLTSPITWGDIELKIGGGIGITEIPYANHRECPQCNEATYVITAEQCARCGYSAEDKERSKQCACGATTNLRRLGSYHEEGSGGVPGPRQETTSSRGVVEIKKWTCGPCEQQRRRSELAAQKLEQARKELDRKVTGKPMRERDVKARYPNAWSTPTWEDDT